MARIAVAPKVLGGLRMAALRYWSVEIAKAAEKALQKNPSTFGTILGASVAKNLTPNLLARTATPGSQPQPQEIAHWSVEIAKAAEAAAVQNPGRFGDILWALKNVASDLDPSLLPPSKVAPPSPARALQPQPQAMSAAVLQRCQNDDDCPEGYYCGGVNCHPLFEIQ